MFLKTSSQRTPFKPPEGAEDIPPTAESESEAIPLEERLLQVRGARASEPGLATRRGTYEPRSHTTPPFL